MRAKSSWHSTYKEKVESLKIKKMELLVIKEYKGKMEALKSLINKDYNTDLPYGGMPLRYD